MSDTLQTKEDIYNKVVEILAETFKLDPGLIRPEANLYTELDIDSIDAIDLLVKLQQISGKRMKPEAFKSARTVQDVVDAIDGLLAQ